MVIGVFTWALLPGELSKIFLGRMPHTNHELKERVEKYIQHKEGMIDKHEKFNAFTTTKPQQIEWQRNYSPKRYPKHPYQSVKKSRMYKLYHWDDRRIRQSEVYAITDKWKERNSRKKNQNIMNTIEVHNMT